MILRDYNPENYQFRELLLQIFEVDELSKAHELDLSLCADGNLVTFANEVKTYFHQTFYNKLNEPWQEFRQTYKDFIEHEISPLFKESFAYQALPSFRIQVPNNKAVSLWHYDSDPQHRHPDGEINFIIAVTKAFGTNAVWAESSPGAQDFKPMEMDYGQFIQFNGNKCAHGNKVNKTGSSRISFDFRVLPISKYDPELFESNSSGDTSRKFIIGDYYSLYEK